MTEASQEVSLVEDGTRFPIYHHHILKHSIAHILTYSITPRTTLAKDLQHGRNIGFHPKHGTAGNIRSAHVVTFASETRIRVYNVDEKAPSSGLEQVNKSLVRTCEARMNDEGKIYTHIHDSVYRTRPQLAHLIDLTMTS